MILESIPYCGGKPTGEYTGSQMLGETLCLKLAPEVAHSSDYDPSERFGRLLRQRVSVDSRSQIERQRRQVDSCVSQVADARVKLFTADGEQVISPDGPFVAWDICSSEYCRPHGVGLAGKLSHHH